MLQQLLVLFANGNYIRLNSKTAIMTSN